MCSRSSCSVARRPLSNLTACKAYSYGFKTCPKTTEPLVGP